MQLCRLVLEDFRNFRHGELELPPDGVTLVHGVNGQGKTNLLEAVSVVTARRSFRGAETEAMIRTDMPAARLAATLGSAEASHRVDLSVTLSRERSIEITRNGNRVRRPKELLDDVRSVAFFPDDLELVKGAPSARRHFLDDALSTLSQRHADTRAVFEKALRQRSQLLRQMGGRSSVESELSLDVWDERLGEAGDRLAEAREGFVTSIAATVAEVYRELSGGDEKILLTYIRSWRGLLSDALRTGRDIDVRTGVTSAGPQRDELAITLSGQPARAFGSQGEQRCLALALRLGTHRALSAETTPVLLLDDVFSELDQRRSAALAGNLPTGQVIVSAATDVPSTLSVACLIEVEKGAMR